MEGIGYVILYLTKVWLHWQSIKANNKQEKYHKIMEKKMTIPIEIMCKGLPEEIPFYMNYVRGLHFDEKPDYKFIRKTFRQLFLRKGYMWDYCYDWTQPQPNGKNV